MNRRGPEAMTVDELVGRFTEIALAQDDALLGSEIARFNRLFDQMEEVKQELSSREGDQRRALIRLYHHPNAQVRIKAAKATLGIAPDTARHTLEGIASSSDYPQNAEARSTLRNLENGVYKPS